MSIAGHKTKMRRKDEFDKDKAMMQRQKYRSMEQNRKPRDKPMHLRTPYL